MPYLEDCRSLLACGVPQKLIDFAYEKGANLLAIFQTIHRVTSIQTRLRLRVEYPWQLQLLGMMDFDYQSFHPNFWKQKDNLGNTPVIYLAWSKNLEGLNWILTNKPDLLAKKNTNGSTIAHFAASSGHPITLQWIRANKPELLGIESYHGFTIAHSAALAGSPDALEWILTQKPELLEKKINDGYCIAHAAAMSGNPEVLHWILTHLPHLLEEKTKNGESIAHNAACSGNPESLIWVLANHAHLLVEKTNQGLTIAHYAAQSGNADALNWIFSNQPELLDVQTNAFYNIAHFAAAAGNPLALQWIFTHKLELFDKKSQGNIPIAHQAARYGDAATLGWIHVKNPDLLNEKINTGKTIAHSAASFGNCDALNWIFVHKPLLLNDKANPDGTIAHFAASASKLGVLNWVLAHKPGLLRVKTPLGCSIAHSAALLGNTDVLSWILVNKPALLDEKTRCGDNIAHYAAWSKNHDGLGWVLSNKPELLNEKTNVGATISHCAARSGNIDILSWIFAKTPALLGNKTNKGGTIVHAAAAAGHSEIIDYLLQEHPALTKKLWICDEDGHTPHNVALADMPVKPNQIREKALHDATNRLIEGLPYKNDPELLLVFQGEWQEILMKADGSITQRLMDNVSHFPKVLRNKLINLEPMFRLNAFSFNDGLITRKQFHDLLTLTKNAIPCYDSFFFAPIEPGLIRQFNKYLGKLEKETLDEKQIFCLQLMIDDYKRGFLGENVLAINILVRKLLASTTLSQLRPVVEITTDLDLRIEKFPDYLKLLQERASQLPLNKDTAETMRDVILPGIKTLICEESNIVQHVTTHFGELYYLHEKLPLHTDHIPTRDPEAYRQTLHRLLINLFGAAGIAYSKGHLNGFCEKLSHGYCFEGRVGSAFEWVASLSEMMTFDELMERFITKEYLAYKAVMSDIYDENMIFIERACDFIIFRHRYMPCLPNPTYAPLGVVTQEGVQKYLEIVLNYSAEDSLFDTLKAWALRPR